ncbi:site-specific DNA-methyltransferase [Syntrophomonas wolfei]|uniref:Site-specific DNA-methyltransferase (Adenine-specific) n=1 Tax=Syntrophomonas wolfei subsp. wolfei (strain DSM 2245B / Goettingen) TaxID=335541 RepID=Q0AWQ3_SYNWW|nr:site-specific DNA-methyltransferase [Syntrophomonas wolfei]ABI68851.1 site-specific DNA-methyltransferase (adenine-specific) [Syntrophomonas wolfei subsp. wolfei str. Goettingen G311]
MNKLDGKTMDLVQHNIDELKKLFPEVITEGKIDFDRLRLLLGDEVDTGKEKYEFTWPGKSDCIRLSQQQSTGTLRPDKESSKDWDTTKNLYIEGDNLEVLRLLQKAYHRKVKMIYIDPPYNTGNDFIYKDDYKDNVKSYKEKTEQSMKANPATAGRYHSEWLNMMYPRLRLAKNLLSDDGAIFISIDDTELDNLKKICNEVFGEENFIACIAWHKNYASANDSKGFSSVLDYILVYRKSENFVRNLLPRTDKQNSLYKYDSNDGYGPWRPDNLSVKTYSKEYDFTIINPTTGVEYNPPKGRCWVTNKNTIDKWIKEGRVFFGQTGNGAPQLKRYLNEVQQGVVPITYWSYDECGHNDEARKEIKQLFSEPPFDTPKPTRLIKQILNISTNKDSIVLDFFSGSSTTAHAVMKLNSQDDGNRKFVMVQLPEPCNEDSEAYKAGFPNICEIGKERIRRAGENLKEEYKDKEGIENLDIGFKVFKLDTSNLKAWDPDVEELEGTLKGMVDPIKEDRTQEDMLYEIMLIYGIDLTIPLEEIQIKGKTAYSVGLGYMIVCLEDGLTLDVIEAIGAMKQSGQEIARVVFRDSGFADDNVKTNAVQLLKKFGIEDFRTI